MKYPKLFEKGKIGKVELKNRIVMPAMGTGFASSTVPWLLVLFGAGLLVGNVLGGRFADRALDRTMSAEQWQTLISDMQAAFQSGHFHVGLISALERVSQQLQTHFPRRGADANADNLPDAPVVKRRF